MDKEFEELRNYLSRIERNTLLASKNVLTFDDVVQLTGYSKSYLYKLTSLSEIPHYKPNGKMIYFDKKEIEDWLKQNRIETTDEAERQAAAYLIRKGVRR